MMKRFCVGIGCLFFLLICASPLLAQQDEEWGTSLDSLRKIEDEKEDSVIYTARYVRYTTRAMLEQGTHTRMIDTTLSAFQYYNPQNQPRNPSIHTGNYGLPTRDLLFDPSRTIGFQTGFHSLERYLYLNDSVKYYRARAPFSELYFVTHDRIFRATVSQNINPRLNIGAAFGATVSTGYYQNQRYNDYQGALFSWYESAGGRYNLIGNMVFNTLHATENGSVLNDTLFRDPEQRDSRSAFVRLRGAREQRPHNTWGDQSLFLKQSFFLGRLDTLNAGEPEQMILPTNRVWHTFNFRKQKFEFYKNESDENGAFPFNSSVLTHDSTRLTTVSNDFGYSFFLRGHSLSFVKNEVKLDLGLQHDLHWYHEMDNSITLQNITLKAGLGYRFSDRVNIEGDLRQIAQGSNFGDYLYEAKTYFLLSNAVGRITLGAYTQNKSPERLFERVNYTYHQWNIPDLNKTKTSNLSFTYENPKFGFFGKAEYFLISDYLYFREIDNPDNDPSLFRVIEPAQMTGTINVIKLQAGQRFRFSRFTFDNYIVYQQSDNLDLLRTPELYTWHSFYYNNTIAKVINLNVGFDVRFNTPFVAPSYAINIGQFYNDHAAISFSSYPITDVWLTATLKRTNFFVRYDYANQGLFSRGYYTVRRYPMNDASFRFGVSWKFYD